MEITNIMSQFTDPLVVELVGKNLWKLVSSFEYHVGKYPSDEVIKVSSDFVTNFASVPRILWWIISPIDSHAKAAAVHDYCYATHYSKNRKRCDEIFVEAMKVLDVKKWKIFFMYWSVRLFARRAWNKHLY